MQIDFKNALVTGGAGFIGSHLVEALVSVGCKVTVLDNLSTGNLLNLGPLTDQITFYKNDIRELEMLEKAAEGCDVIFHLAAVVAVQQTISNPVESTMINDIGTLNVLEAARAKNVRRVVLASSCAVYGDDPRLPKLETMTPRPASPYAVHKLSAEHYARVYFELFGLETVSLRFFNVYGPRQDPSSPYSGVISIFMAKAASNQVPVIYGDGNQSRDFVYVKDVVKANLLAAGADNLAGNVLNIGSGSYVLINRLWELIVSLGGQRLAPKYEPARNGDILHSVAGMELTRSILNFKNDFTLEQGLEMTFDWYKGRMTEDRGREISEFEIRK
ncbi:MAG: NAD-dependent epimerase/dehydratase family protein [Deltaproteobacteria bacterium]|jgi:UDP-glucose 4-epimerase|nr:NAD-dependent epimerase/dehydratase family protein [Deltaproteobacteria bacterium]